MSQVKLTADSGGGTTSLKAPSSTTSDADVVLKLPVADGSANQVLKTDGSGQLSFTSNAGTTINNNADNRVITGSGTANTLEGESNLTFNGTKLSLTPPANTGNDGLEIIPAGGSTASSFKVKGNQSAGVAAGRNGGVVEIDANYYAPTSDIFTIKSRGSTVLNMYGNGNVGIGTSSPSQKVHIVGNSASVQTEESGGGIVRMQSGGSSGNIGMYSNHPLLFRTNSTERMRIDSSGSVLIGTTSGGNTGSYFQADNNDRRTLNVASSSTAAQNQIIFRNPNDRVGTIQTSGTSTSYNTTFSDIASKKNFENWTEDVLNLFKNINPQKFNFKVEDDTASKSKGFIAQEMVDKFPEAYVKQEDEMYMFNPSGMAVYLMKALQESVVKIEALETKVAALEAA